jgi:hypothetical protein
MADTIQPYEAYEAYKADLHPAASSSASSFPAHLRPSPERPPVAGQGGCMLVFGLGWTLFSLLFLILPLLMFWRDWGEYRLLKNSGETVEGVIIERRIDEDSDGDTYYVTYQYLAPVGLGDRGRFSREQSVRRKTYNALPIETRVSIIYAPSEPGVARLAGELRPPFYLLFMAAFGGLFVVIGLVLLVGGWEQLSQASALRRRGQVTQGTLLDRWIQTDSDGDREYCVAYSFTPTGGPQVTRAEYNRAVYEALNPGDLVSVRYLPKRPDVSRLE